ncbi:hypothetical protein ASD08_18120 [Streptomyces sp. Root369]|nr:hypothetical protein ASD08_18120 [Streptomyces sp. Root369]
MSYGVEAASAVPDGPEGGVVDAIGSGSAEAVALLPRAAPYWSTSDAVEWTPPTAGRSVNSPVSTRWT